MASPTEGPVATKRGKGLAGFYVAMGVLAALLGLGVLLYRPLEAQYYIYRLRHADPRGTDYFPLSEKVFEAAGRGDRSAMDALIACQGKLGATIPLCSVVYWPPEIRAAFYEQLDRWPGDDALNALQPVANRLGYMALKEEIDGYQFEDYPVGARAFLRDLEPLAEKATDPLLQEMAQEMVTYIRGRFAEELTEDRAVRDLGSDKPYVRGEALRWLCYCHAEDTSMAEILAKALKDPDWWVRRVATFELNNPKWRGSPGVAVALVEALADETSGPLEQKLKQRLEQMYVCCSLMALRDPLAVEPLEGLLKAKDSSVRARAANLLGGMGAVARPAVPALESAAANDDDAYVRQAAVEALKEIRAEEPPK